MKSEILFFLPSSRLVTKSPLIPWSPSCISGLTTALATKANTTHSHRKGNVTSLSAALASKADANASVSGDVGGTLSSLSVNEMETYEHSKCKPLSIAVAVDATTRQNLAAEVASMPAKGKIAAISRKKYGKRKDRRRTPLVKEAYFRSMSQVSKRYCRILPRGCRP